MRMADRLVKDGYLAAGYEYVAIDDCWMATNRTASNELQADPTRFPSGIKALADYVGPISSAVIEILILNVNQASYMYYVFLIENRKLKIPPKSMEIPDVQTPEIVSAYVPV